MIKAYFFDWMGTLATFHGKITSPITEEEYNSMILMPFEQANISKNYKQKLYEELSNSCDEIYPDSEEMIEKLKKKGYKLAILSNMISVTGEKIKKKFPNFLDKFDVITFSSEVGMTKPSPRIFSYTLNKLNELNKDYISLEEVMMVGDNYDADLIPAQILGMQTALIDRKKQQQKLEDII